MANYSFLKEAKAYIVYGTTKLQLDMSSISFSQTFTEETHTVRTLHNQNNVFEGSVINKANPANFEMTVNLLLEDDLEILFNRLIDVNSFDLYVSTADDVFKLQTCVITNGTINIERLRPLSLSISGEASKLLTGQATEFAAESITVLRTSASSRTYNLSPDLTVALGGTDIHSHLVSMSIELQNEISWIPWKTVNNALVAGTTMFPTQFNLKGKILAGNITRYLNSDSKADAGIHGITQSLRIKAGTLISNTFYGIDLNTTNCSFTNRVGVGTAFTQNIDWRMVQNPTSLADVFKYETQS
jgi:hypothetical protein